MNIEYILLHNETSSAKVLFKRREVAELKNLGNNLFKISGGTQDWLLSSRVDGEVRPFSMLVYRSDGNDLTNSRSTVLKIKDHVFLNNGYFCVMGGIPEGRVPRHHLVGSKYICKLENFPFSHLDQIDAETKNRLKRHRGIPVGEFYGLGSTGFHVKLADELKDVGLPLAASAYLMYSSM